MSNSDYPDIVHTAPSTLAGRYLRMFWQPIYHSHELPPGRAVPVRIMSEDFTLYRGKSGAPHLVAFRCPHRLTQLSAGWVEEDCIRCFYHGWKFDGSGQCVEQPAEPEPFAGKVRIRSYPARDYLGLIFVYIGDGEPPAFPRYGDFEDFEGILDWDSYTRDCNYFQNLENALDNSHVGFVHRDHWGTFDGLVEVPRIEVGESDWGITVRVTRSTGTTRTTQFGMPNIYHMSSIPRIREIGRMETLFWWVPIDDERHSLWAVRKLPITGDAATRYREQRNARLQKIDVDRRVLAEAILAGKLRLDEVDADRTDFTRLQDDIAQIGQGRIVDHSLERLGRADAGVILVRKIWRRELQALAETRPLKSWFRPAQMGLVKYRGATQPADQITKS